MSGTQQPKHVRMLRIVSLGIAMLLAASMASSATLAEIDVAAAAVQIQEKQTKVLDVREPAEFSTGVIQGAMLIPLGQVEKRVAELDAYKDQPLIVVCATGGRSAQAIKTLSKYGFTQLQNLKGGMTAWRRAQMPVVAP